MLLRTKVIVFVLAVIFSFSGFVLPVFSQEGKRISKKECQDSFNVNQVNFNDPTAIKYKPLLKKYFACKAAINADINECRDNVECKSAFEDYASFYGKLYLESRPSSKILPACTAETGLNPAECNGYMQAWLSKDINFCENVKKSGNSYKSCRALISGNASFCADDVCMRKVDFINAIRSGNKENCKRLKNPAAEGMCLGVVTASLNTCAQDPGVEEFRKKYCNEIGE